MKSREEKVRKRMPKKEMTHLAWHVRKRNMNHLTRDRGSTHHYRFAYIELISFAKIYEHRLVFQVFEVWTCLLFGIFIGLGWYEHRNHEEYTLQGIPWGFLQVLPGKWSFLSV